MPSILEISDADFRAGIGGAFPNAVQNADGTFEVRSAASLALDRGQNALDAITKGSRRVAGTINDILLSGASILDSVRLFKGQNQAGELTSGANTAIQGSLAGQQSGPPTDIELGGVNFSTNTLLLVVGGLAAFVGLVFIVRK